MKKIILLFLGLTVVNSSFSQIITTIAGTGPATYTGDGGLATNATFNTPAGIAFDASGNLFIADVFNNVVRKITTSTGVITTVVGTGTVSGYSGDGGLATAAKLNAPQDIVFDAAGNMYIADGNNGKIRKVNTSGIISTFASANPIGMCIDAAGNIYATDGSSKVNKISPAGVITLVAGTTSGFSGDGGLATSAQLNQPTDVAIDAAGNLYISDYTNNRIRKINTSGIISTIAGTGVGGSSGDGGSASLAQLYGPKNLSIDALGNLFVTTNYFGHNRVRKINLSSGIITAFAGIGTSVFSGTGVLATVAGLGDPRGSAFDAAGNYYIADNDRIRKVCLQTNSVSGTVTDQSNNPVTSGKVYAFKKQPSHAGLLDTLGFANIATNGTFSFSSVLGNDYLIQAVANPSTYSTAIPTYFSTIPNAYQWDSATVVHNDPCLLASSTGNNIKVIQVTPMTGGSYISGSIVQGNNYGKRVSNTTAVLAPGNPLSGIGISLGKKPNGQNMAFTKTDANGTYTFTSVSPGVYGIFVDDPNYQMANVITVTITTTNTVLTQNNYYIDSAKVRAGTVLAGIQTIEKAQDNIKMFPNPATNSIKLKSAETIGSIIIYNVLGEEINKITCNKNEQDINIEDLAKGTYFVRTRNKTMRLIKE